MTIRHAYLALLLLAVLAGASYGDTTRLLLIGAGGYVDNERVFGPGHHAIGDTITIPLTNDAVSNGSWPYDNPNNEIAGVFGLGATTSIVQVPTSVGNSGAFITTENYGTRSVYTAKVQGITLRGPTEWDMGQFPCNPAGVTSGTAQGAGAGNNQIQLAAALTYADDLLNGCVVYIASGQGAGQSRTISDYVGSTDTATVSSNWTVNPNNTSVYSIQRKAQAGSSSTIQLWQGESYTDDQINGYQLHIYKGTGAGQVRTVSDYVAATDTATVSVNWTTTPDATSRYQVLLPEMATAIKLDAVESLVEDCQIRLVRGPAMTFAKSSASGYWLPEYRATGNRITHCFTGIRAGTDARYSDNIIDNCRDYCLELPQYAGAVQSTGNHYYGARTAIKVTDAEGFHSTNDVFSDATEYGLHLVGFSHGALITGGYSQHCGLRSVLCGANFLSMANCAIRVQNETDDNPDVAGLEISGKQFQFLGGHVMLSAYNTGDSNNYVPHGSTAFVFSNVDSYNGQGARDAYIRTAIDSFGSGGATPHEHGLEYRTAAVGHDIEILWRPDLNVNTRLLVVDAAARAGMKNNHITFRGSGLEAAIATPADYIDIPSGGLDASNVITIIDTLHGDGETNAVVLDPATEY